VGGSGTLVDRTFRGSLNLDGRWCVMSSSGVKGRSGEGGISHKNFVQKLNFSDNSQQVKWMEFDEKQIAGHA
jgi:hypothetical protein